VSSPLPRALVVGGGIIGLTSAWQLTRAGFAVVILDPSPGRGATWAAAGMIAPFAEIAPGEEDNFALQMQSLSAWRDLSGDLREATGETVEIFESHTLLTGWDASDRRLVEQFRDVASRVGVTPAVVTRQHDDSLFQGLSDRIQTGLLLEGDSWLDPDQAVAVLTHALQQAGATWVTSPVLKVKDTSTGVSVDTDDGEYLGDVGVVATGVSGLPEGLTSLAAHRVRPVRGMTIRVAGVDRMDVPMVRAYVRGRPFYLVSRPGGYCVLGASSEERADASIEIGELQRLLRDALDLFPTLETATWLETRVGLRPASVNLEPFLEEFAERRWVWSSGHFRHGVTLAPVTARDVVSFAQRVTS